MTTAVFFLLILNYGAVGLLPIVFFRRDATFNIRWILTGLPFFVGATVLALAWLDVLGASVSGAASASGSLELVSVLLSAISIGLISLTIGVHRVPLALWHQDNDAPVQLVVWGPYSRLRHPFYTSFLLLFIATVLAFPHVLTLLSLIYAFVALTFTALREEKRLSSSEFGEEYRRYMERSGRFLPKISREAHE